MDGFHLTTHPINLTQGDTQMQQYLELLKDIKTNGTFKGDRTGIGTKSVFGRQLRFDLNKGFPLVTTKTVHFKSVIVELLWFLQGRTDVQWLNNRGCKIWNQWATTEADTSKFTTTPVPTEKMLWVWHSKEPSKEKLEEANQFIHDDGYILDEQPLRELLIKEGIPEFYTYEQMGIATGSTGKIYGAQWRSWVCPDGTTIDQISELIQLLKTKPDSRRLIVSAWNPADLPDETISPQDNVLNGKMALAACHTLFQFYTEIIGEVNDRWDWVKVNDPETEDALHDFFFDRNVTDWERHAALTERGVPTRKLSCQLYQRKPNCALVA